MSHELELFEQYLVRLRQEKLQRGHVQALSEDCDLLELRVLAREAEFCSRVIRALKSLATDPATFIQDNLRRERET